MKSKKEDTSFEILSKMLDGNIDVSEAISDSKIWFALHHPKVNSAAFHKNYVLIIIYLNYYAYGMWVRLRSGELLSLVWTRLEFWKQKLLTHRYFQLSLLCSFYFQLFSVVDKYIVYVMLFTYLMYKLISCLLIYIWQ